MGKKLVLVGLVQPESEDLVEAFNQWYLGNHVEDTYNCPNVKSVRCFKAARGFMGAPPSQFLTIYEFEGEDAEAAEQVLAATKRTRTAGPSGSRTTTPWPWWAPAGTWRNWRSGSKALEFPLLQPHPVVCGAAADLGGHPVVH